MFSLKTRSGKKIEFGFEHDTMGRITDAMLYVDGAGFLGSAWCHPKDQFVKEQGRKVALADALREARLPVEERTEVWHRYHCRDISNQAYAEMIAAECGEGWL